MTMVNWAGLIVSLITILTSFVLGVGWLVKHYLRELKPNGGSSINDVIKLQVLPAVNKLVAKQEVIQKDVATLTGKFDQHIKESK